MSGPSINTSNHDGLLQPPKDQSHSPTTPKSFYSALSTPATLRRPLSEEDNRITPTPTSDNTIHPGPPPKPPPRSPGGTVDPQISLLQSARMKLSSRDQEAMRKIRSTMMEHSDSGSSNSGSPLSPRFPPSSSSSSREHLRPRRSTLSRQVMASPDPDQSQSTLTTSRAGPQEERTLRPSDSASTPMALSMGSADWVIAIVGHQGVGKSTLIGKALRTWGMSNPVTIQSTNGHSISSCFSQVQPGGKLRDSWKVEFLEMDMNALNLAPDASIIWPSAARITGVVFCYDATRASTLSGLTQAIARLTADNVPMVILACKSDPEASLEVDAPYGNSIGEPFNVGLIEVTTKTAEGKSKMRNALRWLLYKLEQRQRRQQRKLASTIVIPKTLSTPPMASATLEALTSPAESDASSGAPDRLMWRQGFNMTSAENGGGDTASDHRSSSSSLGWMMKGSMHNPTTAQDEPDEVRKKEEAVKENEKGMVVQMGPVGGPPVYASLEDLFNQLFTAIVARQDDALVRAFFLTYRRFCEPSKLMGEFLSRIREVEEYAVSTDIKNWALMKLTGALIDWTIRYPGDLHETSTQGLFRDILGVILKYTFMAHLTADLVMVEQGLPDVVDLDESWSLGKSGSVSRDRAFSEKSQPSTAGTELLLDKEVLYEFDESILSKSEHDDNDNDNDNHSAVSIKGKPSSRHTMSTSSLHLDKRSASSSDPRLTNPSSGSSGGMGVHSLVDREMDHSLGNAVHAVLVMDPRTFAMELTRMQWDLFSAIRPRDIFRHDFGKETDGPVGKSIAFFNHISRWISTMVLANSKPKHRARVFEKFMLIAHELRRLNNYDTLYALISGLQETSIHRLTITHSMISPSKDFQSHIKLMDPRSGYVHYRRAIEADLSSNSRPCIPLLTTILGLINRLQNVRKDDCKLVEGELMIQWDKFKKFAEITNVISDCQLKGSMVKGNVTPSFQKMILETNIITSEDGLWEKSQMLEPSGGTMGGKVFKRLANFVGP